MDQTNQADANDLQKAINDITNPGGMVADQTAETTPEPNLNMAGGVSMGDNGVNMNPVEPMAMPSAGGMEPTLDNGGVNMPEGGAGMEASGDLAQIKSSALADLKPIIDTIDLPAEEKFKLYREMIEATQDKTCIKPAYNAAKSIADNKLRAEALLFIVETINKMSAA